MVARALAVLVLLGAAGCRQPASEPTPERATFRWGLEWPGDGAPAKEPVPLAPAMRKPDCGPGCRMVTTRLNFASGLPLELHFAGRHMLSRSAGGAANYVDLETGQEYDAQAASPAPGAVSYAQTPMGEDCLAKQFISVADGVRRAYVTELCMHRRGERLLAYSEGPAEDGAVNIGQAASDARYVVLGQAGAIQVLDTADGSLHPIAASQYLVTHVSVAAPYVVFSGKDGDVHLVDVRDWSDTNVTQDPALQAMAASDGRRIVWIDERFSPGAPEVVVYDIASKELRRLTDSGARPSQKYYPSIEGDWVVWSDARDSASPMAAIDAPRDRMDVYGYDLRTGATHHLVGNEAGEVKHLYPLLPRLHRGRLYVVGRSPGTPQLYEFELPAR